MRDTLFASLALRQVTGSVFGSVCEARTVGSIHHRFHRFPQMTSHQIPLNPTHEIIQAVLAHGREVAWAPLARCRAIWKSPLPVAVWNNGRARWIEAGGRVFGEAGYKVTQGCTSLYQAEKFSPESFEDGFY